MRILAEALQILMSTLADALPMSTHSIYVLVENGKQEYVEGYIRVEVRADANVERLTDKQTHKQKTGTLYHAMLKSGTTKINIFGYNKNVKQ